MQTWLIRLALLAALFLAGRWVIGTVAGWIDEQQQGRSGMARHVAEQEAADYSATMEAAQAERTERMRQAIGEMEN